MSTREPVKIGEDDDGSVLAMPVRYTDQKAMSHLETSTPDLKTGYNRDEVGPISRSSSGNFFNSIDLRSFTLQSAELATVTKRFRNEMYRNQFPVFVERFRVKCEDCGVESQRDEDECPECGSSQLREPKESEKSEYKDFLRDVNREGQSLRSLMKFEEDIQTFHGVSTIVIRKDYDIVDNGMTGSRYLSDANVKEIVHGDPEAVVPVVDEDGRRGGWWTCPIHRGDEIYERDEVVLEDDSRDALTECPECGCRMKEVNFVEGVDDFGKDEYEHYYFDDEVIQWSRHFETIPGVDGMSPVMPLLRIQALLLFSRRYDMSFLDPENTDLPNKMMLIYTSNPESLRASITKEEEKSKENPIRTGRLVQEIEGDEDGSRVEVVDLTPTELLKNRDQKTDELKSMIRSMFGIPDAMDNDLAESGGLNSEGLQLEINNQAVATAHQDTKDKALDKLCDIIGLDDWELHFVDPQREKEQLNELQTIQGIRQARDAGVPYKITDGDIDIVDHDWAPNEDEDPDPEDTEKEFQQEG